MNFTYSGDPSTSDGDLVRFLIGDTDSAAWQLSDEEIQAMLTLNAPSEIGFDAILAAAACAEALAGKYARRADKSVGDLHITNSQISKNYLDMSARLRRQSSVNGAAPYAGAMTITDKDAQEMNPNRVAPFFKRGMNDNRTPSNSNQQDWPPGDK